MSEAIISEEKPNEWELHIGCHRGTLTSRDSEVRKHPSLDVCRADVQSAEKFYKSIGYFVWFAYAVGPEGQKVKLHEGTSYS